jgi:8-oxo-dGTP diphosphatase
MPIQLVAIAVVEHEGRFLIGRRPAGKPLAGYWEFPGGRVEEGETPQAAAIRECQEETGVVVFATGNYGIVKHEYEHAVVELHFVACRPASDPPPQPTPPFMWVSREDLRACSFPAGNESVLRRLLQREK